MQNAETGTSHEDPVQAAERAIELAQALTRDAKELSRRLLVAVPLLQSANDDLIGQRPSAHVTSQLKRAWDDLDQALANVPRGRSRLA